MVDTSGSMDVDNSVPLYAAIGIGIRIAENSSLGKRIMTFDSSPTWFNLDNIDKLTEAVPHIRNFAGWVVIQTCMLL